MFTKFIILITKQTPENRHLNTFRTELLDAQFQLQNVSWNNLPIENSLKAR